MSRNQLPLSTAIVGCGVIGRTHADAVLHLAGLDLLALVDVSEERASELADWVAERSGTRPATFRSLADLAAAGVVADLVVIATPSGMHVEQAIAALDAGAHVLIEKPLDVELGRARRLAEAAHRAAKAGQVCSVISQHRFDPSSRIVRAAIEAGDFGHLTSAVASVAWWRSQSYYDSGDWRGTWALDGGGALMNQGVHTVDLLLWFLGRPVAVSAEIALLAHERLEVEDTAVATITFESGALAVLHATTAGYPGHTARLLVLGSRGSAVIDHDALRYIHVGAEGEGTDMGLKGAGNQADRYDLDALTETNVDVTAFTQGHMRQYEDLLDAIQTEKNPLLSVDDALLALATVRAVYASAMLGRKVRIDDVMAGEYDDVPLELPSLLSVSGRA